MVDEFVENERIYANCYWDCCSLLMHGKKIPKFDHFEQI